MYHCSLGTATDRIDLLDEQGIHVGDWTPVAGGIDAEFASSSLSDYRRLQYYRELTTEETIEFTVKRTSQDQVIRDMQNLRRMIRLAVDYWIEVWQSEPVYLAAQASCETNRRYAIIHSGAVPKDNNPFGQVFVQKGNRALMTPIMVLERGPFLETAPGTATCIEACAPENYYCWPSYLEFGVSGDNVNCGTNVVLDDLPLSPDGISVEAWVKADGWGLGYSGGKYYGRIATKYNPGNGWTLHTNSNYGLVGFIECATQDAVSYTTPGTFDPDGEWHHVRMSCTGGNGSVIRLFVDGVEVSYGLQQAWNGVYQIDNTLDLVIGDRHGIPGDTWNGDIGWVHIKDSSFVANTYEPRCEIPQVDPSFSVGLWITEGEGATTVNRADSSGLTDGAITGADWACDCEKDYGRMCGDLEQCFPAYLHFDGDNNWVIAGDYALIQDLPDDTLDMIAEAWVKADGWGENNAGHIISKENHPTYTTGWNFVIVSGTGLYGFVNGAGGLDGYAGSGTDEFSPDSQWHHVVMAVDSGVGNVADIYLAVDGTWVSSYSTRQQKTGAYGTDVGDDMLLGNRGDGAYTWDGDIAWIRLSDTLRYTPGVNFTPPPRCTLPDVDGDTVALWIYEGHGVQTWNLAGGDPADISHANMWDCDCDIDVDQSTSCVVQPYVTNFLKTSGLTDAYYTDASGPNWSTNLLHMNLPHVLLPPVPAAGDAIYFGVDSTLLNTGPFCSLVFDIMTAQSGVNGIWEYYDNLGAWQTLTVQDNTNADGLMTGQAFDTTGIKSVHWLQPQTRWGVIDLPTGTGDATAPAVTGWWVRWRVTSVATPTPPWQQNRHIYTISWPYVEIQDEDVPGDIAASLMVEMFNESDHDGGSNDPILYTSRVIAGLRSKSRGEDFVAYFNAADEQNPPFITCSVNAAAGATFQTDLWNPTGRSVTVNNVPTTAAWLCQWAIDATETYQFFGEYRAFLRVDQVTGSAGDVEFALGISYGPSSTTYAMTDYEPTPHLYDYALIELGRVVIPPTDVILPSENAEIVLTIFGVSENGTEDVVIHDLILIPVDQWAGDFAGIPGIYDALSDNRSMAVNDWGGKGRYFYLDSIENPREDLRAMSKLRSTGNFAGLARSIGNRPAILEENKDQRLWFLIERAGFEGDTPDVASIEIAHSVQVYRQAHYLSMRGNR